MAPSDTEELAGGARPENGWVEALPCPAEGTPPVLATCEAVCVRSPVGTVELGGGAPPENGLVEVWPYC